MTKREQKRFDAMKQAQQMCDEILALIGKPPQHPNRIEFPGMKEQEQKAQQERNESPKHNL